MRATTTRSWSIRAQVRVALAGVLLLILPQVALTVYYLVEMSTTTEVVQSRMRVVVDLDGVRRQLREIELPEPSRVSAETVQSVLADLGELVTVLQDIKARAAPIGARDLQSIIEGVKEYQVAVQVWLEAVARAREAAGSPAAFEQLLRGNLDEDGSDLKLLAADVVYTRRGLDERLDVAVVPLFEDLKAEYDQSKRVMEHADRNLVSLTMLTMIFLGVLFFVLPARIVRPLGRLVQLIRKAQTGQMPSGMGALRDDEIGSITRSFQQTMEKLRFFDEQKRDRIVQDAAKLSLILDELSEPAAIVTTQYWVDAANQPFRALFGLTSDESEIPLPALLEEGSSVLEQRLLHAVQSRTTVTGSGLQLTDVDGNEQTYEAYVRPCIDTEGRLTHLLLILRRA